MRVFIFLLLYSLAISATEHNSTQSSKEHNATLTKEQITLRHIKEQQEREKRYAKEKAFYHGKDYNLSDKKIDPSELNSVPLIEPEYDFDMSDVYN